jgi:dTDP-4-amino-4,6-dideoxygalactose transaminase
MPARPSRRDFLGRAATAGAGLCLGLAASGQAAEKTAPTAVRSAPKAAAGSDWPVWNEDEESALLATLRSGKWGRGNGTRVKEFEAVFAARMQAKFCIATSSGTTALLTSLGALNVGPGDEVVLPPYTFVATFNAITSHFALPVFADVDLASFQIDPAKAAAAITPATKLLLPVHIGGAPCDLDGMVKVAQSRNVPLIEDACQAPGAAFRGQPVGTKGIAGCFSFQASKNLTAGEGGAIVTNDEKFATQAFNFHTPTGVKPGESLGRAANYRLTEFQAALLLAQYSRFNAQQDLRNANAEYLTSLLQKIPGIAPARLEGAGSRSAWHLYMFRYDKAQFAGLSRAKFLQALTKEGVSASSGYTPLNTSAHVKALAANPHYQRLYGKDAMARWVDRNHCPVNDKLTEEAVWFTQTKLLGARSEMERIAEKIAGIQKRAGELAKG